jgi:hypothetical protein
MPGITPLLLPWLAILVLLTLKPNRRPAAWLIWLPFGCVIAFTLAPMDFLPSGTDYFLDAIAALAVGLAAIWLLSNYLRRKHRFVTFLCVLLALEGFSGLAFVSAQGVNISSQTFVAGIVLGVGVLISAGALSLDGLICRGRYRPLGLYLWLLIMLAALWLVIAVPFFLFALLSSGGRLPWMGFFVPVFALAALNFAALLPFVILSSASPFFRDRLKSLLNVEPETPPMIAPLPPASLKT